ncbi:hypothetical protein KSE_08510 [Kitasatospora setae KM-6054]|uniref:Transposase n=1 Tax=Kitasatospora setae (strain ATCC 33774 / DSM 43861 / JCM 3304 / KCC A-0304 / NBRC 14216 / KM-6054) TaxID=452652 RepID=E4N659_KITSK|nr:hypothetical protein KSE_08510 [Kitasatospora setae KM-6054]
MVEPLVTAWKQKRVLCSATGDPGSCDLREVVNALLYRSRTGCQRRLPPHDSPVLTGLVGGVPLPCSTAGMLRHLTTPTPAWRDEAEPAA